MNWFSKVIHLDTQTRKNIVFKHILDNDSIGFNELCKGLEKKPKTKMSRNTITKILDELIIGGRIHKKIRGQRMQLTTKIEKVKTEEKNLKKFDRTMVKFEKKLKKLSKIMKDGDLYSVDKVTLLRRFAMAFRSLDLELYTLDQISTEEEIQQRIHRLNEFNKKFFKLVWNDSEDKEVYEMLLNDLKNTSNDYEMDFDAELEDWEDNPED